MTTVEAQINERWTLQLLPHRKEFHDARPAWEAPRLAHMYEHVRPGDTIYDVGAEEGDFTALYRQWTGDTGLVVPFEPQPAYWPAIRQTWEGNGYAPLVAWFGGFVGDTLVDYTERRSPFEAMPDGWPRCSIGEVMPDFGFRHLAQHASTNAQTRLDDWPKDEFLGADIVVMDIEGAEYRALQGCQGLIEKRAVRIFYVSQHPQTLWEWYGATSLDILRHMEGQGYRASFLGHGTEEFWAYERDDG